MRRNALRAAPLALSFALAFAAGARASEDVARFVTELTRADPFVSRRAEAEIRKLGADALPALVAAIESPDGALRDRAWRLFDDLVEGFLLELGDEVRSLALDRHEIAQLRSRAAEREESARLGPLVEGWRKTIPELDRAVEELLAWRALAGRRERAGAGGEAALGAEESERLAALERSVTRLKEEIPDLEEKAETIARYSRLKSRAGALEARREAEEMRLEDLLERTSSREPRVEALKAKVRELSPAVAAAMVERRRRIPLTDFSREATTYTALIALYDESIRAALDDLEGPSWHLGDVEFARRRWTLSLLWLAEIEREGPHRADAAVLLEHHLAATLEDLDNPDSSRAERAACELFRLGNRGRAALLEHCGIDEASAVALAPKAGPHAFLATLLRWRISPRTWARTAMDFSDYPALSFSARRRRIFQFARTAGADAILTLRQILLDDTLETSALVKYAAAKALDVYCRDRLGYLILKSLHPKLVLKRPGISRELRIIQGQALIQAKNYPAAVEELGRLLEESPFDFEGNYHIAFAYLLMKDYRKAIHHFEIARRIVPEDQLTLYNLSCAYSLNGQGKEALEALEAAVEAGFTDAEHMDHDPDLAPVRGLEGYGKILEKARRKARAAALKK